MRHNLQGLDVRGEEIDKLGNKIEDVAAHSEVFRRGANHVRKQFWWKEIRMRMWLMIGVVLLLAVIIVPIGKLPPVCLR
jgi:vesicle-associated membrane protein 4